MKSPILNVLMTTDGSDLSWHALDPAVEVAHRFDAQLHILRVIEDPFARHPTVTGTSGVSQATIGQMLEEERVAARKEIEKKVAGIGVPAAVEVRKAISAADDIQAFAAEIEANIVVMATHGHSGLRRFFLGSTAERMLRTLKSPVLAVHTPDPLNPHRLRWKTRGLKVLLTTDLSEESWTALPWAQEFVSRFFGELTVLSVVDEPHYISAHDLGEAVLQVYSESVPQARELIETKLAGMKGLEETKVEVLKSRNPRHEIAVYAEKNEADLIVMATHGRTGVSHLLMGSTAEAVIRSSTVPILTLHL